MAAGRSDTGSGAPAVSAVLWDHAGRIPKHQAALSGLVTLVDESIGAILACLERCGLTDDTIVVHTSDHGDSLGAHHLFGKETMFEEATRVPLLIRLPGQTRSKSISHPISHIDFVPTLLDLLRQPGHPQCAGKSFLPSINESAPVPENVFIEWAPNRTK